MFQTMRAFAVQPVNPERPSFSLPGSNLSSTPRLNQSKPPIYMHAAHC